MGVCATQNNETYGSDGGNIMVLLFWDVTSCSWIDWFNWSLGTHQLDYMTSLPCDHVLTTTLNQN
jgi:hypothetical protein